MLNAYALLWQKQAQHPDWEVPGLGLYLKQGQYLAGEVIQLDFQLELLGLRVGQEAESLHLTIVPFKEIAAFTLLHLEKCPEFVAELSAF
ncbi:MAG: hypothetical protein HC913_03055 [Microscillaceae bacterium]|nr:hypothetical protein [Microscillaceae bacterium]